MTTKVKLSAFGPDLELRADRTAFWPKHKLLLVADLHLGKDASFRRAGIGVPIGANEATLARLATAIRQTGAERLVVLGDMFHARSSLSPQVQAMVSQFLEAHSSLEITLIRGNHDLGIRKLPASWKVQVEAHQLVLDGCCLRHEPSLERSAGFQAALPTQSLAMPNSPHAKGVDAALILCGHIHPAIRCNDSGGVLRLPCFWITKNHLIFPAFGDFTGTYVVRPQEDDRVWAVVDDKLIDMSNI